MKKSSKSILYLTIIILIITVVILISIINNLLKTNKLLSNNEINKEQLNETTIDDSYVEAQSHFQELKDEQEKLLSFKSSIATAITNEGISTSNTDTKETMTTNISNILKEKTKNATATADNISEGFTAYVNGELITGNGADNLYYKNLESIDLSTGTSLFGSYSTGSVTISKDYKMVIICGGRCDYYWASHSVSLSGTYESKYSQGSTGIQIYTNVKSGSKINISSSCDTNNVGPSIRDGLYAWAIGIN